MRSLTIQQIGERSAQLIHRTVSGDKITKKREQGRASRIGQEIFLRFNIQPANWQLKHVRWFLNEYSKTMASSTRYNHWCSLRLMLQALGKDIWLTQLQGTWVTPKGNKKIILKTGRPARIVRSAKHKM